MSEQQSGGDGVLARIGSAIVKDAVSWIAGWTTPGTGHGDPERDKRAAVTWGGGIAMHESLLESLFSFSDFAYVIVTALPEWGLRHGWDLGLVSPMTDPEAATPAVDAQQIESAVRLKCDELGVHEKQLEAGAWGHLFGGGLILIGAVDGRPTDQPLDERNIQSLEWLRVVSRYDVAIELVDADPGSGRYGEPILYEIRESAGGGANVEYTRWHYTRVIRYPGALTTKRMREKNRGWDHSVLDRVVTKLSLHDSMWDYAGAMMADGSQGVWKIKGLMASVLSGRMKDIEDRFAIADKARSIFKSLLLDSDGESFEYVHREFGGIDGLLAQSAVRTAAAAQMPVTVLFGQSPAGLNATGDSDIRLWYDRVEQYQEDVLRSRLERIISIIFLAKDGPTNGTEPAAWRAIFRPVRKATPMEEAELRARQAQIDSANITSKMVDPDEAAVSRFTSEGWSAETQIDVQLRRKRLLEKKRAADAAATGSDVQQQALAGVQISEARATIEAVATGAIPRDTGIEILLLAFPQQLDRARAEELMGAAGRGFVPTVPGAPPNILPAQTPTADARADAGDGVMIGVFLPAQLAARLAIPGGEAAGDLHITLAYLGKRVTEEQGAALFTALSRFAPLAAPLSGTVGGMGRFVASPSSDGLDVIFAQVDVPGLDELRAQLVNVVDPIAKVATTFDFYPHVTLAYVARGAPAPVDAVPSHSLSIAEIELARGGMRYRFPLGAPPALQLPPLGVKPGEVTNPKPRGSR